MLDYEVELASGSTSGDMKSVGTLSVSTYSSQPEMRDPVQFALLTVVDHVHASVDLLAYNLA